MTDQQMKTLMSSVEVNDGAYKNSVSNQVEMRSSNSSASEKPPTRKFMPEITINMIDTVGNGLKKMFLNELNKNTSSKEEDES